MTFSALIPPTVSCTVHSLGMGCHNNTIAVSFSNNLKGNPNAKYIDVKYFVVNEKVEECKTRQKSNFSKERKNSNLPLQYNLKT